MFHYDAQRTGASPLQRPAAATLQWSYATGYYSVYSSPAIDSEGTLFVGSQNNAFYSLSSFHLVTVEEGKIPPVSEPFALTNDTPFYTTLDKRNNSVRAF